MPLALVIVLLGAAGLALAWAPYRRIEGVGKDDLVMARNRWEYPALAGAVVVAGGLLWMGLGDWRAPLALLVGALCASSAYAVARHVSIPATARGSSSVLSTGAVVGLVQGGLLLISAGCLYLLIAYDPAHFVDFTGFILGAILATLLSSPGGAGKKWVQPAIAALVACFALAVLLPATITMLMGPQSRLLVLPLVLLAAGFVCNGLVLMLLAAKPVPARRAPLISAALFLALGLWVINFMDIYWRLWLSLAAGSVGALVLLLAAERGLFFSAWLALGVCSVVAIVAGGVVPAHAFGVNIALLGMLAGFSLYPALGKAATSGARLSLSAGWLATLLLTLVSLKFIASRTPDDAQWTAAHWILAAMPVGSLLLCLLLLPVLLDWGGVWSKTRLRYICGREDCRVAVASRLHLFVALMAASVHLIAQVL